MQRVKCFFISVIAIFVILTVCSTSVFASEDKNTIPDVNLNEGVSQVIPVDGDFKLTIKFKAQAPYDEKVLKHEARVELLLGKERLVIGFGGEKITGIYSGSMNFYNSNGERQYVDRTWNSSEGNKDLKGKTVQVELYRTGDKIVLKAKKSQMLGSKTFSDVTVQLKDTAQSGEVYLSGENLVLSNIEWNITSSAHSVGAAGIGSENPIWLVVIKMVVTLAISGVAFWLVRRKATPAMRNLVYYDFSLSAATISALFISFGLIMIISWFSYYGANSFLGIINWIFSGVESNMSIPLEGSLFANKLFVLAVLAAGIAILIYAAYDSYDALVIPAMLATGLLSMISLYSWAVILFAAISSIVSELISIFLIVGATAVVTSTNGSDYKQEPEPVIKEEEKKTVEVWRRDGYFAENLRVSRDGERYYDPDDGEWHRIKK